MRGLPAHLTRLMLAGALLSHTGVNAAAQGQGGETLKMRPYGILAGCSEEPARFHPCALEKARTFNPPRTPDGQPDFRGVWARARVTSDNILEYAEVVGAPGGKSMVVDPPDGKIPYQPWAVIKQRENLEHYIAPKAMCFPPAPPLQAYSPGPYQILQEPGRIIFLHDFSHAYRIIHTDGRPHVPIALGMIMGDSRGRWDGNTLVVDVTNLNGKVWFDNEGNFYSAGAHLVERWTMIAQDAIHYEVTIDDPRVYTRSWKMAFGIRRNNEPDYELLESACFEGNRGEHPGESTGLKPYYGVIPPN